MENNALVSVLLPVFKADVEQLKTAVESVLRQTYTNFELLVLYEGEASEPGYHMLGEIDDPRLIIVKVPLKSGLPKSLNIGLGKARGKYIARMDADDYSLPYRFEWQVRFMELHPDIDAVGGICRHMESRKLAFSTMIPPDRRNVRMLFLNAGVAHPTVLIRKEFLEDNRIRYNESIKGSEDYHLWIDFSLSGGRIDSIDKIVLLYRIHGSQASKRLKKEMVNWDNMGRGRLIDAIGSFRNDEKEIIYRFCSVDNHKIEVEPTLKVLRKISVNGEKCGLFEPDIIRKEICYEWIQKAIRSLNKGNGKDMLKLSAIRALWTKGWVTYFCGEYFRKVKGKAISNIGFRRGMHRC